MRGGTTKQSASQKWKPIELTRADCFVPRNDGKGLRTSTDALQLIGEDGAAPLNVEEQNDTSTSE